MGCVCPKAIVRKGGRGERAAGGWQNGGQSRRVEVGAAEVGRSRLASGENRENAVTKEKAAVVVVSRGGSNGSRLPSVRAEQNGIDRRMKEGEAVIADVPPNRFEAEHVVAGWPSWLAAVAPEAVKGWIPRSADSFERLNKIGQGTYSNVYRARDLQTNKIVALKKVRFVNMDPESVRFMSREICILRNLDHPNIVKLEGLVASRMSSSIYLVFEYMEHDLTGLAATPGIKFTEPQVKCYMQQLLHGLDHCHSCGILHRDIKGSNLLIDDNGILKIADFGLSTFFNPNEKLVLTSRVVTLWYRPPELLLGATEYGIAVDMWSAGCILAELLTGKPILTGRTEVEQLHKIFKLCGSPSEEYWRISKLPHATIFKPQHPYPRRFSEAFRDFPPSALSLLDSLLAIEPEDRGTAVSALESEFFRTKPFACDPSTLPKYPPSKELDAKLHDEAMRHRKAAMDGQGSDVGRRAPMDSKPVLLPDANTEMVSLQNWQGQLNPRSSSVKYTSQEEAEQVSPIDPSRSTDVKVFSRNASLLQPSAHETTWNKQGDGPQNRSSSAHRVSIDGRFRPEQSHAAFSGVADLSNLSVLVAARNSANSKYHCDVAERSGELQERLSSPHNNASRSGDKKSIKGYKTKRNIIHYSGPLMPAGDNFDEMLKEHERHIQRAVRKSYGEATMALKPYAEKGQFKILLVPARNDGIDA